MALGFGKKKNEADAAAADAPAQDGTDFDSDTFSLENFAADIEAVGSSPGAQSSPDASVPGGGSANGDALAWDDTALLNFDDPNAFGNTPTNERHGGSHEASPFDDLARELEDIPGLAHQFPQPAPAAPMAAPETGATEPERRTRRKAVSANLTEAIAESTPLDAGTGKKKKEKQEKPIAIEGDKKKLPLVPIIGVAAVLLLGGGAAFMFLGGGGNSDVDATAPDAAPPAVQPSVVNEAAPPAAKPPAPAEGQPPAAAAKPPAPAAGQPSPEVMAQLKALWKKGAEAKHNKDYAGARAAWQQMLKLKPDNPAVEEAIQKLPKK